MTNSLKRNILVDSRISRVTPQIRNVAKHLMVYEKAGRKYSGLDCRWEFNFNERLRPHLATLYGVAGYRSLLARALVMADAEVPWLRKMHMRSDGSLEGLEVLRDHLDADEILEGKIALLAQLLGSLVAYVGPGLALRLLIEVWPKISPSHLDFGC